LSTTYVGIDPGRITGIALYLSHYGDHYSFEYDQDGLFKYLDTLRTTPSVDPVVFVIEDFVITSQTGKKTQQKWSLENIGAIKSLCYSIDNYSYVLQTPDLKEFSTDRKLKSIYWYTTEGGGHANDASRHLLRYLWVNRLLADHLRERVKSAISG
jgi:hypothetical protein